MRLLWEHGEMKPADLQARFPEPIKNPALRSYLTTLLEKGHVTRRKVGRVYYYKPPTRPRSAFRSMLVEFVDAYCGGSIQTLVRHVEKDKLALSLKGATDTLRDVFFSNMSERAGKILREDMEAMGPVRLKDVDEAQMRMVNVAKDLANKGEIMIASKQGEDELIY